MKRDQTFTMRLTEEEVAAILARPDYKGERVSEFMRALVLRSVGLEPPDDIFADHRSRPRDPTTGKILRRAPR